MATYRVLQILPKGNPPGSLVELNDDEARVLMAVGAVEPHDASEPVEPPKARQQRKPRREYERRDMEAKDGDA